MRMEKRQIGVRWVRRWIQPGAARYGTMTVHIHAECTVPATDACVVYLYDRNSPLSSRVA